MTRARGALRWLTVLVASAIVLSACGSGGSGAQPTAAALADRLSASNIGCSGFSLETEQRELGAREQGYCDLANGENVTILTYNTNSARDTANKIAKEFGGIAAVGDRWVIRTDTEGAARQIADQLGGKLD